MTTTRKRTIPFIALFGGEAGERNARMALRDRTTPLKLRAELERYVANPFHAAAVDQEKLLDQAETVRLAEEKQRTAAEQRAAKAERQAAPYRKGGTTGRKNKKTEAVRAYICELQAKHPKLLTPSQLLKKADRNIIGKKMAPKTFADHVRALRKK